MKRHQVLTGSVNPGSHCYSVGLVSDFTFWAYGSGCDLVISSSSQQPVQILSGHGNVLITAVDCADCNGKVAVAYGKDIIIYNPVYQHSRTTSYKWVKESSFTLNENEGDAEILSWNSEGSQLLVGSTVIGLWSYVYHFDETVTFHLDSSVIDEEPSKVVERIEWKHVWSSDFNEKPVQLSFSPSKSEGQLFASVAQGECMIKVWYSYKQHKSHHKNPFLSHKKQTSLSSSLKEWSSKDIDFTFTYLLHPQPVVGFEWRKNFPLYGSERFSNVLISSSLDQICRIWVETKQPVSRLLRFQNVGHDENTRKRKHQEDNAERFRKAQSSPVISSGLDVLFSNPLMDKTNYLDAHHFHIAATINPLADIPLPPSTVPNPKSSVDIDENTSIFTVHWLNNKYYQTQLLLNKFSTNASTTDTIPDKLDNSFAVLGPDDASDDTSTISGVSDEMQLSHGVMEKLITSWRNSQDALFSIHPADGSLLMWHIEYLDENRAGLIRQPLVCYSSRIPTVFSSGNAGTLCPRVILFVNHSTEQNILHSASYISFKSVNSLEKQSKAIIYSDMQLLSKHYDGSLNLWQLSFSDANDFSSVTSISHNSRFCGHCFHLSGISPHPVLPLLLTSAIHVGKTHNSYTSKKWGLSELILWRVDTVGPLSYSGGLSELARVSCQKNHLFNNIAWFPVLFPTWCLGFNNNSPSTGLISLGNNTLQIYQVVAEASQVLADIISPGTESLNSNYQNLISQQSSANPGCLLHLLTVEDDGAQWGKTLFLGTFTDNIMSSKIKTTSAKGLLPKFFKKYYAVMLEESSNDVFVHTWKITFLANFSHARGTRSRRTTVQLMDSSDDESDEEDIMEVPHSFPNVTVNVEKLSTQKLDVPYPAKVVSASSGRGSFDLFFTSDGDESIYPAPFHICTACDNSQVYFWLCNIEQNENLLETCVWQLWEPAECTKKTQTDLSEVHISLQGIPLVVKAANSNLLACMWHHGPDITSNTSLFITVYECASTGGLCWNEQDTITYMLPPGSLETKDSNTLENLSFHLDWLSREEGSFFLVVGCGTNVQIFSLAPKDIKSQTPFNEKTNTTKSHGQPLLKQSSLDVHTRQKLFTTSKVKHIQELSDFLNPPPDLKFDSQIHWRLLRWTKLVDLNIRATDNISNATSSIQKSQAVTVSWARDGILIVATETEMHVFCQWISKSYDHSIGNAPQSIQMFMESEGINMSQGLSEFADKVCPSLPQYHPLVLSELMNSGHIDAVKEILIHLAICMNGDFHDTTCSKEVPHVEKYQFSDQLAHILQLCASGNRITPLPLQELLSVNGKIISNFQASPSKQKSKPSESVATKNETLDTLDEILTLDDTLDKLSEDDDNELDEILGITTKKKKERSIEHIDLSKLEEHYFGKEHCRVIHEFLVRNQLPGLTSLDQMELMALADTLEMTNTSHLRQTNNDDITQHGKSNTLGLSSGERGYAVSGGGAGALDNCGLRFVMAMHNHLCLLNSLPASNRKTLLKHGLSSCQFAWAFHSETEEELLSMVPSIQQGTPDWSELKSLGVCWWIRSTILLRRLVEQMARAAFLKKNDPLDAALFYLALNKKSVLCGLFRSVKDVRMNQFFQHNFAEERWHRAALKNAFALMGKQRFEHAAAFFLLAGSVCDAIEVCIDKLKDMQLALLIVRLRDNPDITYHQLLSQHVLHDHDVSEEPKFNKSFKKTHSDSFQRSMAYWTLGKYDIAVSTLLEDLQYEDIADIFNFYAFLRSHPIVLRNKAQSEDIHSIEKVDRDGVWQSVTEQERRLIFQTAVVHLEAGCPVLALDSLSKLPKHLEVNQNVTLVGGTSSKDPDDLSKVSLNENVSVVEVDTLSKVECASDLDWSQPVGMGMDEGLELDWSEDEGDEESDDASRPTMKVDVNINPSTPSMEDQTNSTTSAFHPKPKENDIKSDQNELKVMTKQDVFAHHLRITASFKVFVQELKAIAHAYSTDGGQLRSKLYLWLENTSNVLHDTFGTSKPDTDGCPAVAKHRPVFMLDPLTDSDDSTSVGSFGTKLGSSQAPSLHELILADNQDWKTRRKALSRRKKWLQCHHNFLRTLLSYCNMHDSAHGLLATMRMELLLLLQESLQDKNMTRSLVSPLPSPSGSIPLITSSIASCKMVVADPLTYLCHMTRDVLRAILRISKPPHPQDSSFSQDSIMLCSQAAALSTCIYQSLCDTSTPTYHTQLLKADTMSVEGVLENSGLGVSPPNKYLQSSVLQQSPNTSEAFLYQAPTSVPAQWPGVAQMLAMLNSESLAAGSRTKIMVLLCEATVSIFVSLLVHGLQTHNTSLLYRLCNHNLGGKMWNAVFGGGLKIHIKYSKSRSDLTQMASDDVRKLREKLNRRVLQPGDRKPSITSSGGNEALSYQEKFVPPEISLWDWFLTKPFKIPLNEDEENFDSDAEDEDSDSVASFQDEEDIDEINFNFDHEEHPAYVDQTEPDSYGWKLMRFVIVVVTTNIIQSFLCLAGFDINELNNTSALLSALLRTLHEWQEALCAELDLCQGPPPDFIGAPIIPVFGTSPSRPEILKYQAMLEPSNTPFKKINRQGLGCRRLWRSLVKNESMQETFIKYIFKKKISEDCEQTDGRATDQPVISAADLTNRPQYGGPVKILHKDTELLAAFCVNNVNSNCIALASAKDIQEIDISDLLASDNWSWMDEPSMPPEHKNSGARDDDFLIVNPPKETKSAPNLFTVGSSVPWTSTSQTGQGANVLMKRTVSGVRRMESHPSLPYYVTGHRDGGIYMWEWGHHQQISQFEPAGQSSKVSNIHFSSLGNKICSADGDGFLTMWQVSSSQKPFFRHLCHDRGTSDFCFVSSASILATAGISSNHRNVAIWDTLMPRRSILVKDFTVHEQAGASCIKYLAKYNTLLVGGKNGVLSTFDNRCLHSPLHKFSAHDAPIKCLAVEQNERFYVTGSATGDVKIWDSLSHKLLYASEHEHARSSLFRNFGSGTVQVMVTSEHLLTCGADGSLKMKLLPDSNLF
ncbi:dmX-like protein 1 [Clavelina lepadiformis]|uniref:dmX-like protein 1 n=1 Tax=Clavelina lepadiformis TaxID=159417 RepID=UPI004042D986